MIRATVLAVALLVAFAALASADTESPIKNVVVLMLENRSFDHMAGMMKEVNPKIDGCLPSDTDVPGCSNPDATKGGKKVQVDDGAVDIQPADPCHSIPCTTEQIFGDGPTTVWPPPMNGFIKNYQKEYKDGSFIMKCFNQTHVPVMSTLVQEFGIFNRWHAGVPGPTEVNRMFAFAASSGGMGYNDVDRMIEGIYVPSIFETLDNAGSSWGVYFRDFPTSMVVGYNRLPKSLLRHHGLDSFFKHAKAGTLPAFSWLEPRYYEFGPFPAQDQHPDHDVAIGEKLIKDVYEHLVQSPQWNETLFLITYDEHGGFFDHVAPPNTVNPDGKVSTNPPFDFTRLGVRVPTVAISPWIEKGTVIDGMFEHSSLPATLREMFAPKEPFLNNRDKQSRTFTKDVVNRKTPRTDFPKVLPTPKEHRELFPHSLPARGAQMPLTELQTTFALIAAGLNGYSPAQVMLPLFEEDGAEFTAGHINQFFQREVADLKGEF
eukprot:GFYU01008854.1.p1 GENE.GFYU01008854.1~~GFYU01008854.1.p1  ORF type:complete len:488 (-),score=138.84 GFYU01008854.1:182-1645(-)